MWKWSVDPFLEEELRWDWPEIRARLWRSIVDRINAQIAQIRHQKIPINR